ncbi:MAG: SDR family oxidoreductase [Alphaproteobacteria bacterium]|nr:SDR family oxidoreductase [Alphaproteobacteria bacterium]
MDLAGKKVVIAGGSSGIGKAAARQLVAQGCDVALLARDADRLEAARVEIAKAGSGKVVAVSVDVTDPDSVTAGAAAVVEALGGVDVLIANQGFARCAPVWEADLDAFQAIMDTNYFGHVRLVKAFVPHLIAQKHGAVCLVTSMLGFMSFYGYGAYAASKFAIVGFAESLRQELLPFGVQVNVFYPPTTDTPGLAEENESKPPLTWAIEGTSRKFTADQVAATMLAGITKNRFVQLIGVDSWAIYYLSRWAPWLVRFVIDGELRKHIKKHGLPA